MHLLFQQVHIPLDISKTNDAGTKLELPKYVDCSFWFFTIITYIKKCNYLGYIYHPQHMLELKH